MSTKTIDHERDAFRCKFAWPSDIYKAMIAASQDSAKETK